MRKDPLTPDPSPPLGARGERLFTQNAFAAGYAYAKAVFECARARWGGFKASEVRP